MKRTFLVILIFIITIIIDTIYLFNFINNDKLVLNATDLINGRAEEISKFFQNILLVSLVL